MMIKASRLDAKIERLGTKLDKWEKENIKLMNEENIKEKTNTNAATRQRVDSSELFGTLTSDARRVE